MERPEIRAERRRGDVQEVPCLDDTSSNTIMQWTRDQCRPLRAQWAQVRLCTECVWLECPACLRLRSSLCV